MRFVRLVVEDMKSVSTESSRAQKFKGSRFKSSRVQGVGVWVTVNGYRLTVKDGSRFLRIGFLFFVIFLVVLKICFTFA